MTSTIVVFLIGCTQTLITSLLVYYIKKQLDIRDEKADKALDARKQEQRLSMLMMTTGNKLAKATAMALKRGHTNGEIEEVLEAYEKAEKDYFDFINNQFVETITK